VSTPAQVGLPSLIESGAAVRRAIAARIETNHDVVRRTVDRHPHCTALRIEGGWSAVIRVPAGVGEDALVQALVEEEGVLVHPGYFFDFAHEAFIVVSLLTPTDALAEGLDRALRRAQV
jgi:aspartate/methionine/tyrosine aminotransferase